MMSTKDFKEKQIIFVLLEDGEKISFKNDNIIVTRKDDTIKHQSTCYLIFAVFVCGHLCLTSGIVERAKRFGFAIVLMNYTMHVYEILSSPLEGNVLLRKKQYCGIYSGDSFELGAYIISNKLHNQQNTLKQIREKSTAVKEAIEFLEEAKKDVRKQGLSLSEIMGMEGASAKIYFSAIFEKNHWIARRPRVKQDMTNCLLDIGYSLLFNIVHGLIAIYGFDSYVGVLHRQFYQRKSLVCDLVEPFRAIVDMSLRKALNLGQCHEEDFIIKQRQYFIYGKNAAPYIQRFIKNILEYRTELFRYVQSYYRAFMRDKPVDDFPFANLEKP
ncbi:MAG: type I-C CRISPR-associated endonuclease Cas1c [Termitinemataceae bacterium]|nr:MAG: type I-C CRISPR-associated endonuclease Cas1c [Termitinemataceae bacterium]